MPRGNGGQFGATAAASQAHDSGPSTSKGGARSAPGLPR